MHRWAGTLALLLMVGVPMALPAAEINWKAVEEAFDTQGAAKSGEVYKFSFPRTDLNVSVDGVAVKPGLALGSWVALKAHKQGALVMGDLVLLEAEVNPVMDRLAEAGINVTALHKHLLSETPKVMYMHIEATGDPVSIAGTVRKALEQSATPLNGQAAGGKESQSTERNYARLQEILRAPVKAEGGIYKFSIPRAETIKAHGTTIPAAMGTAIAIAFQPIEDGKAIAYGDFVMRADEVNPVLRTLKEHGLSVTALHNHMLHEEPQLYFMHFWGVGDPMHFAQGLRAALDEVNVRAPL
jgi:hypothetical protein